ncbi:MAG: fructose-1,6-bisphosphatase [Roseiflexaceae bacterium]
MINANRSTAQELRLLQLLARRYPSITAAHTEMINLNAILALPKGTDHFISDIHGAYAQFDHILRHASGAVRRKVAQTFAGELPAEQQEALAALIYYPERTIQARLQAGTCTMAWMEETIVQLARVGRTSAQKYTRSKVRKRLGRERAYILEELLTESLAENAQKEQYYRSIVRSIVALGEGQSVISTLANLIQRLVVDRLFVLGDIFDRGPAAERVVDRLIAHDNVLLIWGNHDVAWMGAASGCDALIATVVRMALRYGVLETLLDGYAISLRALMRYADLIYAGDPCEQFLPKHGSSHEEFSADQLARMHKAITVMQLKLEAQIIKRHPEYGMDDRIVLEAIDDHLQQIELYGQRYPLRDSNWPTLQADRSQLTDGEAEVVAELRAQFQQSQRLRQHIGFIYSYGRMYRVQDGNLLLHGCLPVDQQGNFLELPLAGEHFAGPELLARYEQLARAAFFSEDPAARQIGQDSLWYLWCGPQSPLYGRLRMTTFERYAIADPATHDEPKGPYYALRESEAFCQKVLAAFGADPEQGRIINGHTPVKVRKGERPLMGNGRLIVIDGGMSEAYQSVTGIAGYTLISNSHELLLAVHEASGPDEAHPEYGATPRTEVIESYPQRLLIADTDIGRDLFGQLEDLNRLVEAYRQGVLVEQGTVGQIEK